MRKLIVALFVVAPCSTGLAAAQSATTGRSATPTFSRDVAPILQRSCQRCHRPGSIGPMPLLTYDQARPWARAIKTQVANRTMPPWHIDRAIGIQKFKNDPSLTDKEIQTIVEWADAGAPQGNPGDVPPAVQWADEKSFSFQPDLIVRLKQDFILPADGSDQWVDLPLEDSGITEDRYIQAVEIKPLKGAKVVHHANASASLAGEDAAMGEGGGGHLVEYAVGKAGEYYPEGSAKLLPAGSKLMMNMHLHAWGEETAVNTALGIKFYPKGYKPKYVQFSRTMPSSSLTQQSTIDIRPGDGNARTDSYSFVTKPMLLTAYQPHMHFRGKRQCLEIIYPPTAVADGTTFARTEIINCADFRFNWHLQYTYAEDVQPLIPAGSVLHLISWHDNSASSKSNPDPTAWVGYGRRSTDEMALAWMEYAHLTEAEFKALAAARSKATASTTAAQQP